MSSKIKMLGIFLIGAGVGAAVATSYVEKRMTDEFNFRLEEELDKARAFYKAVAKPDFKTPADAVDALVPPEMQENTVLLRGGPKVPVAYDKVRSAKEMLAPHQNDAVQAHNVFDERDKTGEIIIISEDEFNEGELEYQMTTLHYYKDDNILTDERDNVMTEDRASLLGDDHEHKLTQFGVKSDRAFLHVRNNILNVDFEIVEAGSYKKEVLDEEDGV